MRLQLLSFIGIAALTFGCEGGQTGDLSGNTKDGGETSGNGCKEVRTKLASLDEVTDFGSAEQVLEYAEQSFDAPLTWKEPGNGAAWQTGPESGESAIHIEVTRGESAYLLTYEVESDGSGEEIALGCPGPQLGVEAQVTVTTDGGALAETFDTLLRSSGSGMATFGVGLDLSKLSGSLETSSSNPKAKLVQVSLNATLLAEGTTGSLTAIEQTDHGEAVSASGAVLAVWPDAPACSAGAPPYNDGSGIGIAADAPALGITGDAAAKLLSDMTPVNVEWLDGTGTELTLTTTLLGDGCLRASNSAIPGEPSGSASYPASFKLESADGRLLGEYTGTLTTAPEGDLSTVTAQAFQELSPADVADSGFGSAVVPSTVERLVVAFDARHAGVVKQGSVRLNGITDPPCVTAPQPQEPGSGMGSPGCAGSTVTPLETASWGQP